MTWLSSEARPGISNAVRAVVGRYCSAPKYVHWRATMNWYLRICETDERIWFYFSERYSRRFEFAGVCRRELHDCGS